MKLVTGSKLNLFLTLEPRAESGFHPIETIYHSVGLVDEMTVELRGVGTTEVIMEAAIDLNTDLPASEDNLVTAAIALLRAETGRTDGVSVAIRKRIPIAAGLAGGSGDAAGVLVGLARLWDLGMSSGELADLGARLGSDVPFCLRGGTCIGRGRGEVLESLPALDAWFVLGISDEGLSTREVYRVWDESESGDGPEATEMSSAVATGDPARIAALLHNDLERAVFSMRPDLADKKTAVRRAGALGALVSGSGPTIFGLCGSRSDAVAVAQEVSPLFDRIEVVRSIPDMVEIAPDDIPTEG